MGAEVAHLGLRDDEGVAVVVVEADGEVAFSSDEHIWVAKIDWNGIRQFAG